MSPTEIYNFGTNSWSQNNVVPYPHKVGLNLAFGNKEVLYAGGDGPGGQQDKIIQYKFGADVWTERTEKLPAKRKDMAGIVIPNGLITCT